MSFGVPSNHTTGGFVPQKSKGGAKILPPSMHTRSLAIDSSRLSNHSAHGLNQHEGMLKWNNLALVFSNLEHAQFTEVVHPEPSQRKVHPTQKQTEGENTSPSVLKRTSTANRIRPSNQPAKGSIPKEHTNANNFPLRIKRILSQFSAVRHSSNHLTKGFTQQVKTDEKLNMQCSRGLANTMNGSLLSAFLFSSTVEIYIPHSSPSYTSVRGCRFWQHIPTFWLQIQSEHATPGFITRVSLAK